MRFFVESASIDKTAGTAVIKNGDAAHIKNALRLKKGDIITACDGMGLDYACEISAFEKGAVRLSVINAYPSSTEPEIKVSLFQAYPKYGKMEYVIEKCVELGVFEIYPVITQYTQGKPLEAINSKTARFNSISAAAAKQCNRAFIPRIHKAVRFTDAADEMLKRNIAIAAWEGETQNKMRDCLDGFTSGTAALLIGPEGGFSRDETEVFKKTHIRTVNLGKRILRTETAGMVCLTIFFNETGEF